MPSREHRDAAYPMSSSDRAAIRFFVLQNRLGLIPDEQEDYLSVPAIAAVLNREEKTIQCLLPRKTTPRHPLGPYFQMSVALKVMSENAAKRKARRRES